MQSWVWGLGRSGPHQRWSSRKDLSKPTSRHRTGFIRKAEKMTRFQVLTPSRSAAFSPFPVISCRRASIRGVRRRRTVSISLGCSDINGATKLWEVRRYLRGIELIAHRRRNSGQKLRSWAVFMRPTVRLTDRDMKSGSRPLKKYMSNLMCVW